MKIRNHPIRKIILNIFLITILFIILILSKLTPGLKGSIDQEFRIFFKQTDRLFTQSYLETIENISQSLKYKFKNEKEYEKIEFHITFKNLRILKNEREKALELKYNLSRLKVPVKIIYKNKIYNGKMRLKGGVHDHFGNNKQYSFWVKLKKNQNIFGFNEFSITQHFSRQFPNNLILNNIGKRLGLIAPDFKTVKVKLNGDDWGLMLIEEQFSKSFFDKRNLIYNPVVKFTNEDDANTLRILINKFAHKRNEINYLVTNHGKLENHIYNRKDFLDQEYQDTISYINNIKTAAINNQLNSKNISDYFNVRDFSKVFLLSIISRETHSLGSRNVRYYMNPITQKFSPIPTDRALISIEEFKSKKEIEDILYNLISGQLYADKNKIIFNLILKNKNFQASIDEDIISLEKDIKKIKIDIDILCRFQVKKCKKDFNVVNLEKNILFLKSLDLNKIFDKEYYSAQKIDTLNLTKYLIQDYLQIKNNIFQSRISTDGEIHFYNLAKFDVKIIEVILLKSKKCKEKDIKCKLKVPLNLKLNATENFLEKSTFYLEENLLNYKHVQYRYNIEGQNKISKLFNIEKNIILN